MNRRETLAAFVVLGGAPPARAQSPAKVPRIGFLSLNRAADTSGRDGGFTLGLKEHGYMEGRNIVLEHRDAAGRIDRLPALAAELVALRVDVIVAPSTPAAQAAKQASAAMPIVFAGAAEPITDGLVASLARPGGNVTGLSNASADLVAKRVELLKQVVPNLARVAVLWHPLQGRTDEDMLKAADHAARALGMRLLPVEAHAAADFERAFAEMHRGGADSLMILPIATFFSERKRIIELAAAHRLPTVYTSRAFVDDGGFMSYGANLGDLLRRAAGYVDRILKGARPSDLPVEQATKFELVIHRGAARALGVTLPRPVLLTADDVIG